MGSLIPEARVRPDSSSPFDSAPNGTLNRAVDSALATPAPFCHDGRRAMAPKELLPLIEQLKGWRKQNGFSQYEAARVLRDAGIPVTTDSLQAWEIGRSQPAGARRAGPGRVPPKAAQTPIPQTTQGSRLTR
jgi:hypothetical protein